MFKEKKIYIFYSCYRKNLNPPIIVRIWIYIIHNFSLNDIYHIFLYVYERLTHLCIVWANESHVFQNYCHLYDTYLWLWFILSDSISHSLVVISVFISFIILMLIWSVIAFNILAIRKEMCCCIYIFVTLISC